MNRIKNVRRDLMKKHDVVEFNIIAHDNAKKVKNFKEVEDELGNVLGI
jgi:hypothetical protein